MNSTSLTTVSGREVDLLAPKSSDISFEDIAEHLAKENRYNGATPGVTYSVAEHCVRCADYALAGIEAAHPPEDRSRSESFVGRPNGGKETVAAYALTHDFHEAYLKDDTTPKKRALDARAKVFGPAEPVVLEAFTKVTETFDQVIHEAAGLLWPPPKEIAALVQRIDRAMLVTEWLQLRPKHRLPPGYEDVTPLNIVKIHPMSWEVAKQELLIRMEQLLPVFSQARQGCSAQAASASGLSTRASAAKARSCRDRSSR